MHVNAIRPLKQYTGCIFKRCDAAVRMRRPHPAGADVLHHPTRPAGDDRRARRYTRPVQEPPDEVRQRPRLPGPARDHPRTRRRPATADRPRGHAHRRRGARHRNRRPPGRVFRPRHQRPHADAESPPEAPARRCAGALLPGPGRRHAGRHHARRNGAGPEHAPGPPPCPPPSPRPGLGTGRLPGIPSELRSLRTATDARAPEGGAPPRPKP